MEPDAGDLEIPLEAGGVTWRVVLGLALAGFCGLDVVSWVWSAHPQASDSTPIVLFLYGLPAGALLLSGVALHRRWPPNPLFRALPAIACAALGVVALGFQLQRGY